MCEARKFVFIVFAFLILTALASVSAAKTIYVPDYYAKIQWGDGVYVENVNVDKSSTIKSENGSANCIVQAADPNDHVFKVKAVGDVIRSIPAPPGTQPNGLAWDGNHLWMSSYMHNAGIYKLDPTDGSVLGKYTPSVAQYGGYGGLTYDGTYLWEADSYGGGIYKLTLNCSIISTIPSPDKYPSDLAWDGNYIWVYGYPSQKIYKIDPTDGSIVAKFDVPEGTGQAQNAGLTYDGSYLWLSGTDKIFKLDPSNCKVIASFPAPCSRPDSLAWDGKYLWCASFDEGKIYQVDIEREEEKPPTTIYVPDNYTKIQWAVDNASDGDTIIVRDGTYYENVVVDKQLTIKSENGSAYCIVNGSWWLDVFTLKADGIRIEGFTITGGRRGIYILSNNNTIINNNISSNNWEGIDLSYSNNNCIINNNISSNNGDGILLEYSNNNSISENNISSNRYGIYLWDSNKTMIRKNEFINDGLFVDDSYGSIVEDNKVNGKPLVYLEGESDEFIDNAGQVILVKCKNITIMNSELTDTDIGIELFESDDCLISNNNIGSNYWHGIYLWYSNNNRISNNDISSNNRLGIVLGDSNNNSISNNNDISNNGLGIYLEDSNNNSISNNDISNNGLGIVLGDSNKTMIRKSEFINDGLFVYESYDNIVEDNKVNGKPLVYLEGESDEFIDNAGQVILVKCKNITVINSELTDTDVGIELFESDNCLILNNNISSNNGNGIELSDSNNNIISKNDISSNNRYGIDLENSNNNSISDNDISSNNRFGIYLLNSNKNIIYMNNFINNTYNTYSYYSTNIWNSIEPITYTYRGSRFTNYMGNYWDDYNGSDANGDGIGETPYIIDSDKDNYPLIEQFEHYFLPTPAQIFDTGRPDNPYPSISGKFIGTIRTNTKVIATKLYTYACEGTGGHTEHAIICNSTWCAEAKWEGYKEDWMNIYFNRTVVLMPYETYNITIVTGSYPQIHHTDALPTKNGWINCSEFVDANGKVYYDWIPAIMLWS